MKYIRSNEIDPMSVFFHFSRIDNRDSIEKNGLQAVAGGENMAGKDRENKTIYFSKGFLGLLKAIDVWARWEYDRLARILKRRGYNVKREYEMHIINGQDESYDKYIMKNIVFDKLYSDFKNRQYYVLDLIEGKDGDFEFGDIDIKKVLSRNRHGEVLPAALWMYGPYSDFGTIEEPNNVQEDWNMNTIIGERTIPSERLKIVETENGRTDGLSVILEAYDKFRGMIPKEKDEMFEILDSFIDFAKERYKDDMDFKEGLLDFGRRKIDLNAQNFFQRVNKINESKKEKNPVVSFVLGIVKNIKDILKRKRRKKLSKTRRSIKDDSSKKFDSRKAFLESITVEQGNMDTTDIKQFSNNEQIRQNKDEEHTLDNLW